MNGKLFFDEKCPSIGQGEFWSSSRLSVMVVDRLKGLELRDLQSALAQVFGEPEKNLQFFESLQRLLEQTR